MFICICNAITERQVQSAVATGAHTMSDLQAQLGVATCCGCCAETAVEYLPGGRYASHATPPAHMGSVVVEPATAESAVGTLVVDAANDAALSVVLVEVVARRA